MAAARAACRRRRRSRRLPFPPALLDRTPPPSSPFYTRCPTYCRAGLFLRHCLLLRYLLPTALAVAFADAAPHAFTGILHTTHGRDEQRTTPTYLQREKLRYRVAMRTLDTHMPIPAPVLGMVPYISTPPRIYTTAARTFPQPSRRVSRILLRHLLSSNNALPYTRAL